MSRNKKYPNVYSFIVTLHTKENVTEREVKRRIKQVMDSDVIQTGGKDILEFDISGVKIAPHDLGQFRTA